MTAYAKHFGSRTTSQSQAIPGREDQVQNNAGGFVFQLDPWGRLDRFLILGAEGGTYYVSERKLTIENAQNVLGLARQDGVEVVRRIVDVSVRGRAPRNDPAIFALAIVCSHGSPEAKRAAFEAVPKVCRTGTHLYQFVASCEQMRGWGRGLRKAVAGWYMSREASSLALQAVKYQQRNGWSHRDLLRLSHPKFAAGDIRGDIAHWMVRGWPSIGTEPHPDQALRTIWAFEAAKRATTEQEIVRLIRDHGLVRECVPSQFLNSEAVWDALLLNMPMTAMIRSLAKMTAVGLLRPMSEAARLVGERLTDVGRLRRARVHPLSLLVALRTYAKGAGEKGSLTWTPVQTLVNALNDSFYLSFGAVRPTGKRWMLALDVSGSMGTGLCSGMPITPREASAAMAMVTAAVEPQHVFCGFTGSGRGCNPYQSGISELAIHPRQRLDDVLSRITGLPFGPTDCALPMLYAMHKKLEVDVFYVLTDNETWCGNIHPTQALAQYRERTGIPAKLVVAGMTSTGFTIADPNDAGQLDVVGFDTSTPDVVSGFVGGFADSNEENDGD